MFGLPSCLDGIRIMSTPWMCDRIQTRFPRSKKKRIRKKWAKNPKNWSNVPWKQGYLVADPLFGSDPVLHVHPQMVEELAKRLQEANERKIWERGAFPSTVLPSPTSEIISGEASEILDEHLREG